MRNIAILPCPTAVLLFASFCNGFLGNFGRNVPVRQKPTHQEGGSSFGDVNLPLGDGNDVSGNVWTQGAIDPQMYNRHSQTSSHGSSYQAPYGGYQLPDHEQSYQRLHTGYDLPLSTIPATGGYELPPSPYDPSDYSNYYNQAGSASPADAYGSQPPMSPTTSYQSFGLPYTPSMDYSISGQDDDYPHEHGTSEGTWSTTANSAVGLPYAIPTVNLPDHTHDMDLLSLGLRRVVTGGSSDEGGSGRVVGTSRRKGKAIAEGSGRVKEPQTARLSSRRRERVAVEHQTAREPRTARDLTPKEVEQLAVKRIVAREFRTRKLNSDMHQQTVAVHLCEIKITHPGYERAIGNSAVHIVEGWDNGPEYMYDFQGWTVIYRNKVNLLRRRLEKEGMAPTPPEVMKYLLDNFRDIHTNFHGTLADPAEEEAEMQMATKVWSSFWKSRLEGALDSEDEVTMSIVAERSRFFKSDGKSIYESMNLIKKYLRTSLGFKYYDINELELMLKMAAER